ncbi:hypothetical protein SG34_009955 [Thalassomonas viridans]|uniref:Uncharacterized protein n=1 Tax=Thalassomonas viridans TaxID=137584 RepID=A0AAE9Z5R6_9GAMM|nr:hypothetical protein [Thalassomonas viridans]WDE07180.1 hypothetical protein SG34_009955 [Thalassomonas viridans]
MKTIILALSIGLGASTVVQAGPEPGSEMCERLLETCLSGGVRACGAYNTYCLV